MNNKSKQMTFVFNSWSQEITNIEFSETLSKKLKQINQGIEISFINDVFELSYDSKLESQVLSEIEQDAFFDIFKDTISIKFIN
jgi:hypothetical protein